MFVSAISWLSASLIKLTWWNHRVLQFSTLHWVLYRWWCTLWSDCLDRPWWEGACSSPCKFLRQPLLEGWYFSLLFKEHRAQLAQYHSPHLAWPWLVSKAGLLWLASPVFLLSKLFLTRQCQSICSQRSSPPKHSHWKRLSSDGDQSSIWLKQILSALTLATWYDYLSPLFCLWSPAIHFSSESRPFLSP